MMRDADVALHRVKDAGRGGWRIFDADAVAPPLAPAQENVGATAATTA